MNSIWLWLTGSVVTAIAVVRALMFTKIRVGRHHATLLIELLEEQGKTFKLYHEITDGSQPRAYNTLGWLGFPFLFQVEERMLRVGTGPGSESGDQCTARRGGGHGRRQRQESLCVLADPLGAKPERTGASDRCRAAVAATANADVARPPRSTWRRSIDLSS